MTLATVFGELNRKSPMDHIFCGQRSLFRTNADILSDLDPSFAKRLTKSVLEAQQFFHCAHSGSSNRARDSFCSPGFDAFMPGVRFGGVSQPGRREMQLT
jgi:hypothetical protein